MGQKDLKKIRAGEMDPEGEGNTNAGRILGIVATCMGAFQCLLFIVVFTIGILGAAAAPRLAPQPAPATPAPRAPVPPRAPRFPAKPANPPQIDDDDKPLKVPMAR
jgi:hypothetical protein